MGQEQYNISHMQCWLFQMAQAKWGRTPQETTEIFERFNIFDFIADCYEMLHLSSYNHVLIEIENVLAGKGIIL